MNKLAKQLIDLGHEKPDLRVHIRPILNKVAAPRMRPEDVDTSDFPTFSEFITGEYPRTKRRTAAEKKALFEYLQGEGNDVRGGESEFWYVHEGILADMYPDWVAEGKSKQEMNSMAFYMALEDEDMSDLAWLYGQFVDFFRDPIYRLWLKPRTYRDMPDRF